MEARVFSWSAGVGVCWTLILMFGTVDFVSGRGTDYERQDIYNTDSSRLTKLKRLAEELRSQIHQQRFLESRDTSDKMVGNRASLLAVLRSISQNSGSPQPTEFQKREEIFENQRNDNQASPQLLSDFVAIKRLYRSTSLMETLRSEYNTFYDLLSAFVPQLKSKFISGAPADLAKVDVLLSVLPKDDSAFDNGDVASVVKRASMAAQIAYDVVENIGPFVQSDQHNWLSSEKSVIKGQLGMLDLAIFNIALEENIETPEVIPAGIGGVNPGIATFTTTMDYEKIRDLYNAMRQGSG